MMIILPDYIRDDINRRLDNALAECPGAEKDRDYFYNQLLGYFKENGEVPEISFVKKDE